MQLSQGCKCFKKWIFEDDFTTKYHLFTVTSRHCKKNSMVLVKNPKFSKLTEIQYWGLFNRNIKKVS